jgi:alanine dehydrogenase
MKLRILGEREVRELLPVRDCIEVMASAMRALSSGTAYVPLRSKMVVPGTEEILALMPASMDRPAVLGAKVLSIAPRGSGDPGPTHLGGVLLFERPGGRPLALIDAASITEIRTCSVSALATRLLARDDSSVLAVLGTGTQARAHALAIPVVRPVRQIWIWGRDVGRAKALRDSLRAVAPGPMEIEVAPTVSDAVGAADIVCTATGSRTPVLEGRWIRPGTHINAVGAAIPGFRELDTPLVARSRLFVDRRESAEAEADDFRVPLAEGAIPQNHIVGELGDALLGRCTGRENSEQVTLFKSVGLAVEDIASADQVYRRAEATGKGAEVEF